MDIKSALKIFGLDSTTIDMEILLNKFHQTINDCIPGPASREDKINEVSLKFPRIILAKCVLESAIKDGVLPFNSSKQQTAGHDRQNKNELNLITDYSCIFGYDATPIREKLDRIDRWVQINDENIRLAFGLSAPIIFILALFVFHEKYITSLMIIATTLFFASREISGRR